MKTWVFGWYLAGKKLGFYLSLKDLDEGGIAVLRANGVPFTNEVAWNRDVKFVFACGKEFRAVKLMMPLIDVESAAEAFSMLLK